MLRPSCACTVLARGKAAAMRTRTGDEGGQPGQDLLMTHPSGMETGVHFSYQQNQLCSQVETEMLSYADKWELEFARCQGCRSTECLAAWIARGDRSCCCVYFAHMLLAAQGSADWIADRACSPDTVILPVRDQSAPVLLVQHIHQRQPNTPGMVNPDLSCWDL